MIETSGLERQPHVVRDRKLEALTHDADHREVLAAELDVTPEHVGVAAKPRAPHLVADHRDRRRRGLFVGLDQHAAHQRLTVGDAESRDAHLGDVDGTRIAGHHEVAGRVAPRADVGHRAQRLAPLEEVVEDLVLVLVLHEVHALNLTEAIALRQRQRGMRGQAEDLVDDEADPDREGHRHAADDGQARILHEHTAAELDVHRPAGEPSERARVALMFLDLFDTAEGAARGVARFLGVHPLGDVLVLEQLQVRIDLARQLLFGAVGAKQRQQSEKYSAHYG